MTTKALVAISLSMSVSALLACGSSSNKSSSTPSQAITGVDGGTQASQLTAAEQTQAIQDIQTYLAAHVTPEKAKKVGCDMAGIFVAAFSGGANTQSTCQTTYNDCMAQSSSGTATETSGTPQAPMSLATCDATVDQVNQCLTEQVTVFDAMATSFTCSSMSSASTGGSQGTSATSTCDAIATTCPAIADASSGSQTSN